MNIVTSFFVLVLVLGFPRLYGTEVPMALLIVPFYIIDFFNFINRKPILWCGLFFIILSASLQGLAAFILSEGEVIDLFFHFIIYAKFLLAIFFSYVIYRAVRLSSFSLVLWILFQCIVIYFSSISYEFYSLMLGFISPRSADVFQHIFGLRALGFGVFHMDGAITLVFAVFFYILISRQKVLNYFLAIIIFPFSMMVARSAIVPYFLFFIKIKGFSIKFLFLIVIAVMFFLSFVFESGPMFQALELFRNIASGHGAHVDSVSQLKVMLSLPSDLSTYLVGDGRYYGDIGSGLSFYMNTDIGYLRMLYYSGVPGVFLFLLVNLYLPFYGLMKSRIFQLNHYYIYFSVSILVFLIINAKGIQSMPIFSLVSLYFLLDSTRFPVQQKA
jgi:hypothetical protein